MQVKKSVTTAGILGVFLGWLGAHDFYLHRLRRTTYIHLALAGAGFVFLIIAAIIDTVTANSSAVMTFFYVLGYFISCINIVWGATEGYFLLARNSGKFAMVKVPEPNSNKTPKSSVGKDSGDSPSTPSSKLAKLAKLPHPKLPTELQKHGKFFPIALGVGGLLLLVAIVVTIHSLVSRVDYGESYQAAREIQEALANLYDNADCQRVIDDADSTWTSEKNYNQHVSACKKALSSVDGSLIDRLGASSGIRKDKNLNREFTSFKNSYESAAPDLAGLSEKLDLYQKWHSFWSRYDDVSVLRSEENDYRAVAELLTDSGNDALREFGEGWLEKILAYRAAYLDYWGNSSAGDSEYTKMITARKELQNYEENDAPDITDVAKLNFSTASKMYSEFRFLYDLIEYSYEQH